MKNKLFSFILSFVIIAVATTAVNCVCAFAQLAAGHQVSEKSAMTHCEQQENAQEKSKNEKCCVGCKLQLGALNSQNADLQFIGSSESFLPSPYGAKNVTQPLSKDTLILIEPHEFKAHGVSIPNSQPPIYLVLQSFLI